MERHGREERERDRRNTYLRNVIRARTRSTIIQSALEIHTKIFLIFYLSSLSKHSLNVIFQVRLLYL